jgi:hypothetical protein
MAFVDIGHPQAHQVYLNVQGSLNYANVDSKGNGVYAVKSARRPQYMGANIIPLKASAGSVSVQITASAKYTATLAISGSSGIRYVDVNASATAQVASGEKISLVIANTPDNLILYDPFSLSSEAKQGLDYSFTLTGATV